MEGLTISSKISCKPKFSLIIMLSYPAAKTDHSAISSAFTQARSRAQNNFIGVWEIRSIQLLLNNKFLLLLGARSRVQTSL